MVCLFYVYLSNLKNGVNLPLLCLLWYILKKAELYSTLPCEHHVTDLWTSQRVNGQTSWHFTSINDFASSLLLDLNQDSTFSYSKKNMYPKHIR